MLWRLGGDRFCDKVISEKAKHTGICQVLVVMCPKLNSFAALLSPPPTRCILFDEIYWFVCRLSVLMISHSLVCNLYRLATQKMSGLVFAEPLAIDLVQTLICSYVFRGPQWVGCSAVGHVHGE